MYRECSACDIPNRWGLGPSCTVSRAKLARSNGEPRSGSATVCGRHPSTATGWWRLARCTRRGDPPTFFASRHAVGQAIDAWDAASGKPRWRVKIASKGTILNGPAGCAGGGVMFFTGGGEGNRDRGETVAIDPRTGRVLWRSEAFASQTGTPSYKDGRIYLPGTYNARSIAWRPTPDRHSGRTTFRPRGGMSTRSRSGPTIFR